MAIHRQLIDKNVEEMEELWQMAENKISEGGSKYPGMTYEEGIDATMRWLWEDGDHPLKEE